MLKKVYITLLLSTPLLAHDAALTHETTLGSAQKVRQKISHMVPSERIAKVSRLNIPALSTSSACTNFLEFGAPPPSQEVVPEASVVKSRMGAPDERVAPISIAYASPRVSSLHLFRKEKPATEKAHDYARKLHFPTCSDLVSFNTFDIKPSCSISSFSELEAALQRSDDRMIVPTLKRSPAFRFSSKENRKKSTGVPIKNCYISIRPSPATRSTVIESKTFEEFLVRQHLNVETGKVEEFPAVESTINGRVHETLVFRNISDAEEYVRGKNYSKS